MKHSKKFGSPAIRGTLRATMIAAIYSTFLQILWYGWVCGNLLRCRNCREIIFWLLIFDNIGLFYDPRTLQNCMAFKKWRHFCQLLASTTLQCEFLVTFLGDWRWLFPGLIVFITNQENVTSAFILLWTERPHVSSTSSFTTGEFFSKIQRSKAGTTPSP